MADPVMKVLFGPPGGGKTRQAARDAVRVLVPDAPEDQLGALHQRLVAEGRIIWVTFHPSYTYEDFVEGLRPVVIPGTGISYEPRNGPFRIACERCEARRRPMFYAGQTLEWKGQRYEVVHAGPWHVVVRLEEGRGTEGQLTPVSLWVAERVRDAGFGPGAHSIPGSEKERQGRLVDATQVDKQTLFGMTGPPNAVLAEMERQAGAGYEAVGSPVVLVIDEINRADLSRVFGELITLLEPDKRIGGIEERRVHLPYSGDALGVPMGLSIIGTMNTADRSLSLLDLALRRRFEFEEVVPDPGLCPVEFGGVDLQEVLREWNGRITALLSRDHRIGHSYLMEGNLRRMQDLKGLGDDPEDQLKAVAFVIRTQILPLLMEYFHDDWRKMDLVFGRDFSRGTGGLLQELRFDALDARAADVVDLGDVTDYNVPGFWDPTSQSWEPDRFRQALNG